MKPIQALFALIALFVVSPATAQDEAVAPVEVMVLGTFHWHNPGADTAQFEDTDIMGAERQRQIEEVVTDLSLFEPTKIALERRRHQNGQAEQLASEYAAYRAGEFELTSNEVHQLGFRLANAFDHEEVHAVDYAMGMNIPAVIDYMAANDPDMAGWFQDYIQTAETRINRATATGTMREILHWMNRPAQLAMAQEAYVRLAGVGAEDGYVGATASAQWYERNLRIFANLSTIAQPGDRIILIIGQGHAPVLRQFVRDHPDMKLVEPNDYLL